MSFMRVTSPHAHVKADTGSVMRLVLYATIPGVITLLVNFGSGILVNLVLCTLTAIACEAGMIKLRGRPVSFYLKDYSVVVTAVLLAIALPPLAPWWIAVVGTAFSVVIGKQLYGGLGYNPFNPAMLGYVVLLISFPVQMTSWAAPAALLAEGFAVLNPLQALACSFGACGVELDAITMATPLDIAKNDSALTTADLWQQNRQFGYVAGVAWEWVNLAFLVGGIALIVLRVFTWHGPVGMLAAITLLSALFYDGGSSASGGSPLFHLFSGATMFGAFFIVTDPVTSTSSNRTRFIYGALIGSLVYIIRVWGNYPDAVAFAVLLGNFCAPLIDHYLQPRTYGHATKRSAKP